MRLTSLMFAVGALCFSAPTAAQDRSPKKTKAPRATRPSPVPKQVKPADEEDAAETDETTDEAPVEEAVDEAPVDEVVEAEEEAPVAPAEKTPASEANNEDVSGEDVAGEDVAGKKAPATKVVVPPTQCTAAQARKASKLGRALVAVEAPGTRALGFVFHSRRHVLTAASIVDTGRGIRVRFSKDGESVSARVVAIDEGNDLAILEMDSRAPHAPLRMAASAVDVGDAVMTLRLSSDANWSDDDKRKRQYLRARGRHFNRNADAMVHRGAITFADGNRLRTNAFSGGHEHWGAPVLNCKGHVVAVATSPLSDEVVGREPIASIDGDVADEAVYRGGWSLLHPHAALVGQMTHKPSPGFGKRDKWVGFSIGGALIGHDRWFMPTRFTATFLAAPGFDEPFAERTGFRLAGSAGLGYRIMLKGGAWPVYLVPAVGGTVMFERITEERTTFVVDGACPAGGCLATPTVSSIEQDDWRFMPTFGGGIQLNAGELSYQFILDTEATERSIHQLTLGVQF